MKRRLLVIGTALYLLILFSFSFLQGELLILTIPLLLYLGWGLWSAPGEIDLEVEREISHVRVPSGRQVQITLHLTNRGSRIPLAVIRDDLPEGCRLVHGDSQLITALDRGEGRELSYTLQPDRGYYVFDRIKVQGGDHFGLQKRRKTFLTRGRLFAHPRPSRVERIPIRPRLTNVYSGFIPARVGGPGVEFFGIREYQPGDPIRWVNWRASARYRQTLFVNQYQQERVADVGLILDTRRSSQVLGEGGRTIFEYAVRAAGSLADRFLQDGNRVGLLLYGTSLNWTIPQYGKVQRQRLMDQLSRAQVGSSQVFEKLDNLPTQILPRRAQLVFISPLQAEDADTLIQLAARGYAVMVISPDPVAFESQFYRQGTHAVQLAQRIARVERRLLLQKLQGAGIRVLDWDLDTPLRAALKVGLTRPIRRPHHPGGEL